MLGPPLHDPRVLYSALDPAVSLAADKQMTPARPLSILLSFSRRRPAVRLHYLHGAQVWVTSVIASHQLCMGLQAELRDAALERRLPKQYDSHKVMLPPKDGESQEREADVTHLTRTQVTYRRAGAQHVHMMATKASDLSCLAVRGIFDWLTVA